MVKKAPCRKGIYLSRLIEKRAIEPCRLYRFCAQYFNYHSRLLWRATALLKNDRIAFAGEVWTILIYNEEDLP
jgi:hypothetical protein